MCMHILTCLQLTFKRFITLAVLILELLVQQTGRHSDKWWERWINLCVSTLHNGKSLEMKLEIGSQKGNISDIRTDTKQTKVTVI